MNDDDIAWFGFTDDGVDAFPPVRNSLCLFAPGWRSETIELIPGRARRLRDVAYACCASLTLKGCARPRRPRSGRQTPLARIRRRRSPTRVSRPTSVVNSRESDAKNYHARSGGTFGKP